MRATNGVVHVVDGVIVPMDVVAAAEAAGLTELLAPPTVDGASLAAVDIVVTNGVVHVTDAVMPPSD